MQMDDWNGWPDELPAQAQQVVLIPQPNPAINLNEQLFAVMQDLNEAPILEDPEEMIIHPPPADLHNQNHGWEQNNEEEIVQLAFKNNF